MFPKSQKPPFIRWGQYTVAQLFRKGWNEIPEVMGAGFYGLLGGVLLIYSMNRYIKEEKFNRRYKTTYTVYRPEDERVSRIRKFENSPQPTSSPEAIREYYACK